MSETLKSDTKDFADMKLYIEGGAADGLRVAWMPYPGLLLADWCTCYPLCMLWQLDQAIGLELEQQYYDNWLT